VIIGSGPASCVQCERLLSSCRTGGDTWHISQPWQHRIERGWGGIVDVATCYGLGGSWFWTLVGQDIVNPWRLAPGPSGLLYSGYWVFSYAKASRGHGADCVPPSTRCTNG
jgi:hypothetical protein